MDKEKLKLWERVDILTDKLHEETLKNEDEVLPPMTIDELDAFLTSEDTKAKEDG